MHHDGEDQADGVDNDMSLAAVDFLARVVAADPPFSVVLTLWLSMIAALGVASRPAATRTSSRSESVNLLPDPRQPEAPKVTVNGAPRRELPGEHAPRAPAAHEVHDGVDHFASVNNAGASSGFGLRNEWCDDLPLLVAEVAGVAWSFHDATLLPHTTHGQAPP